MTVLESILRELQELPASKQVEVAGYVLRMSEAVQQQRWTRLGQLYGSLPDLDAVAFEEARIRARRPTPHG